MEHLRQRMGDVRLLEMGERTMTVDAFRSPAFSAEAHKETYEMMDELYALIPDDLRREEFVLLLRRMAYPEMQLTLRLWEGHHRLSNVE
jgi:hypothetical protein